MIWGEVFADGTEGRVGGGREVVDAFAPPPHEDAELIGKGCETHDRVVSVGAHGEGVESWPRLREACRGVAKNVRGVDRDCHEGVLV